MAGGDIRVIRAVMPADGWHAVYVERTERGHPRVYSELLVGWATIDILNPPNGRPSSTLRSEVGGLAATDVVYEVAEDPLFVGYMAPGGSLEAWQEKGDALLDHLEQHHPDILNDGGEDEAAGERPGG